MLSHESNSLLKFLSLHGHTPLSSPLNNKYLNNLRRKMMTYVELSETSKTLVVEPKRGNIAKERSLQESLFFPTQIKKYIEEHFHLDEVEEYEANRVNLEVLSYREKSHSIEIFSALSLHLSTVVEFLLFCCNEVVTCPKIHLLLIPTLLAKRIKNNHYSYSWDPENVNNAFSIHGNCESIVIYRFEELLKVCIHECIHVLHLDDIPDEKYIPIKKRSIFNQSIVHHPDDYENLNDPYQATLFFESKFLLFANYFPVLFKEAYTESWSCILNVVYISCITDYKLNDLMAFEKEFVCFQVAKILYVSGIPSWPSFMKRKPFSHQDFRVEQSTSLFSYFVLRSALLWDLDWFFSFFSNIQFSKNGIDIAFCYKHCMKIFESDVFSGKIQFYMKKLSGLSEDNFVFKTMRMTCCELYL
jgi:hypothetical protein